MFNQYVDQFIQEATEAGFILDDDNVIFAVDRGDFFHIVYLNDNEGCFDVGRFYKKTEKHTGDFSGTTDFESDDVSQAIAYVVDWKRPTLQ